MQEPKLADELRKMPEEPLLPIEKKVVLWSLLIGIVMLAALVAADRLLFPR